MKTSCIRHPKNHPLIVVHRWQIEACDNDPCGAALLAFFEYWHNVKLQQARKAAQANDVAEAHGDDRFQDQSLYQFHNEDELERGVMFYSRNSIAPRVKILEKKGFISIHKNPNSRYKFDKTRYFLFHPRRVQAWLDANYPPEKDELDDANPNFGGRPSNSGLSSSESGASSTDFGASSSRSGSSSSENGASSTKSTTKISLENSSEDFKQHQQRADARGAGGDFSKSKIETTRLSDGVTQKIEPLVLPNGTNVAVKVSARDKRVRESQARQWNAGQQSLSQTPPLEVLESADGRTARVAAVVERLRDEGAPEQSLNELAESFFETHLDDAALLRRLTGDYKRGGLSSPVSPKMAQKLIRENANEVRWQLILWPSRPEAQSTFTGNSTGAFVQRVQGHYPPEVDWKRQTFGRMQQEQSKSEISTEKAEADKFWERLSKAQRERFSADFIDEWRAKYPRESFNANNAEHKLEQIQMLNDPRTREWLLSLESPNATEPNRVLERAPEPAENDEIVPIYSDEQVVERIVSRLLVKIETGDAALENLDECRAAQGPAAEEDDDLWARVCAAVKSRALEKAA